MRLSDCTAECKTFRRPERIKRGRNWVVDMLSFKHDHGFIYCSSIFLALWNHSSWTVMVFVPVMAAS
jgi:hypothetical protein